MLTTIDNIHDHATATLSGEESNGQDLQENTSNPIANGIDAIDEYQVDEGLCCAVDQELCDSVIPTIEVTPTPAMNVLTPGLNARIKQSIEAINNPDKPAADILTDRRTLARVIAALQNDSPEREALLKSIDLTGEDISPRLVNRYANGILKYIEQKQAELVFPRSYQKLDWTSRDETRPVDGLNTRRLSDVTPREVKSIWKGVLALGKLTLLSGNPGVGKTWLMLDMIARMTMGQRFPDGYLRDDLVISSAGRRNALIISSEDADDDTLLPRLQTLGGDPSRVHSLTFMRKDKKECSLALDKHINDLDAWLGADPLVELVVFDPISAVLGRTDSHRDSDVRGVLTPLSKLAEKRQVSILCINHLTKATEGLAIFRSMGSIAFVAAGRLSWQVIADRDQRGRSLLLPIKTNLGELAEGFGFRISDEGIKWDEERVKTSADEALAPTAIVSPSACAEAEKWLNELLKNGPVLANDVNDKAKVDEISESTLKRAKRNLSVSSLKDTVIGGKWRFYLPQHLPQHNI